MIKEIKSVANRYKRSHLQCLIIQELDVIKAEKLYSTYKKFLERWIQKQNWNDEGTEAVEWNEKKRVLQTNQGV